MLKSFFIVATRNIIKNKAFTVINLAGLSVGITSAVFILLFIISELSYDKSFTNHGSIFRLYIDGKMSGSEFKGAWTSPPSGPAFAEEIPEIMNYTRIRHIGQVMVTVDEKKFLEEHLIFADSCFLKIFDIPVIYGNPLTMLKEPYSMVLTKSVAEKYFGDKNPVGRLIDTDTDSALFKITGVIEDLPEETHLEFELIGSYSTRAESRSDNWLNNFLYTYFLLDQKESRQAVEEKLQPLLMKYLGPQLIQILGIDIDHFISSGNKYGLYLQALTKVHFEPDIQGGLKPPSDEKYLMIFGLIAIMIIIIASINFMNLSTAKASNRAKEVGMRKVMGSGRELLIRQFLWESVILSFISLLLSLVLVEILIPYFNNMMDLNLKMQYLSNWYTLPGLIFLVLLVGILSGSYPAFVLSAYSAVDVLKGKYSAGIRGGFMRNVLVVLQFAIAIIIITSTIVIYSQLRYFYTKDPGFEKENVIVIYRNEPLRNHMVSYIQELEKNPDIIKASNSTVYAGTSNNNNSYQIKGRDRVSNYLFHTNWADHNFLETYGMKMVAGRFFNPAYISDSSAIVINETAIRKFEIDDPFNTILIQPTVDGKGRELHIIGVIRDFHISTFHEEIAPYLIQLKPENRGRTGYISVKVAPGKARDKSALTHMENVWKEFTNDEPFQYFFLDEHLNDFYNEEIRSGKLALVFSFLAILIAGLGLFGLTMYTTQRRTKEIGIRKVHGAGSIEIVLMIIKELSILVSISTVIAWLVSYILAQSWLAEFKYRIELGPLIFIAGAGIAYIIALSTVSIQAYLAARVNPADSLHHE